MSDQHRHPDLILRGASVRPFHRKSNGSTVYPTCIVYAHVTAEQFAHPSMVIRWARQRNADLQCGETVNLTFQQNRMREDGCKTPARGFMASEPRYASPLSYAYAMTLEAHGVDHAWNRRATRWTLDLLDAIEDLHRTRRQDGKRGKWNGCDLLPIIVGVRLLGHDVQIFNTRITERRNAHRDACRRNAAAESEVSILRSQAPAWEAA
jgi:hypothetical protein